MVDTDKSSYVKLITLTVLEISKTLNGIESY